MVGALFLVGAVICGGCGFNLLGGDPDETDDVGQALGLLIGGAMMVFAVLFSRGWPA